MRAASDIAEWWDQQHKESKKHLDAFVDDNPNLFGVLVAMTVATAMEVGAGTVDVLRFGEGAAEGGLKGLGQDALRLISIAGPIGKGAKLVQSFKSAKLARLIVDPGGPICAWVSATKAARQTGQKAFAAVEDLLKATGFNSLAELPKVFSMSDVLTPLRKIGMAAAELKAAGSMRDVQRAVPRDGSVVMFFVKWRHTTTNERVGHALYAFYDHLGRFRLADRTGAVVSSLE
jgi:hypothetical protein